LKDFPCYSRGECLASTFIEFRLLATPKEWHEFCLEKPNCQFFTHFKGDVDAEDGCFVYSECVDFGHLGECKLLSLGRGKC